MLLVVPLLRIFALDMCSLIYSLNLMMEVKRERGLGWSFLKI